MGRNIKRFLALLTACCAGILFCMAACLLSVFIMDYTNGELETGLLCFLVFLAVTFMIVMSLVINLFNSVHDELRHSMKPGRWVMNTIFAALIFSFMTMFTFRVTERSLVASAGSGNGYLFPILAMSTASILYVRNYHRLKPRGEQIESVIRNNSLQRRRFSFLVKSVSDENVLYGILSGQMKKGDQVYILAPGQDPLKAKVSEIYSGSGRLKKAKDTRCGIRIFCPKDPGHSFVPFTVISDILPSSSAQNRVNAENPRVSAMIDGYPEMYEDSKFMSVLVYDFVHAQYLVPAKTKAEGHTSDITEPIKGSQEVTFLSVSTNKRPDSPVFPIFTDWNALEKYEAVMKDEDSITLVMSFQQAVQMMSKGYEGMVINPFGPGSFFLSEPFIDSITKLDGYREEFIYRREADNEE